MKSKLFILWLGLIAGNLLAYALFTTPLRNAIHGSVYQGMALLAAYFVLREGK